MKWTPQQDAALKAVDEWLEFGSAPVFRLFGYAGTGKTTLATYIAEHVDGKVLFAAFTGKAALVMRDKGCAGASTIHSLIYRPGEGNSENPDFFMNRDSPVKKADLVIIDECSMVDEELGRDLLSFGTKVLVLGDPAQLPPVKGAGFFTEHEPDYLLTEVHRQARDNPIISLSMDVREGNSLEYGRYGESRIITKDDLDTNEVVEADQILVGINKTRRSFNQRMRQLKDFEGDLPNVDERLICLRNNKSKGLLNGSLWDVTKISNDVKGRLNMRISPESELMNAKNIRVKVWRHFFEGREQELTWTQRRNLDEFDYGYVLTTHKSQGSQWDNIVLFDESWAFRENARQWLYTAITRAAEQITIVR
jgi:exodeoxyribonuclease-5